MSKCIKAAVAVAGFLGFAVFSSACKRTDNSDLPKRVSTERQPGPSTTSTGTTDVRSTPVVPALQLSSLNQEQVRHVQTALNSR